MTERPSVLLVTDLGHSYGRGMARGIDRYQRIIRPWRLTAISAGELKETIGLNVRRFDGVLGQIYDATLVERIAEAGTPAVNLSALLTGTGLPAVLPDNVEAGRLGARHLLATGLHSLGFCGLSGHGYSIDRRDGFLQVAGEADLHPPVFESTSWPVPMRVPREQHPELNHWLAELPKPTGVLACTDRTAADLIRCCDDQKLRVPQDVAVIGVDNDEVLCYAVRPALSSVDLHVERVGFEAAELLQKMMAGHAPPDAPLRVPPLAAMERASTDTLVIDDELVAYAVALIRGQPPGPTTPEAVAAELNVEPRKLGDLFAEARGRTLAEEIRARRIRQAKALLAETAAPLRRIATRSGFESAEAFAAAFRQEVGMRPEDYRSRLWGE